MGRKRWTPQTEITESLVKSREKQKWQLGFRRYVLEQMPSEAYAPYFGLAIEPLRKWFEIQFTHGLHWENFGKAWQFDHVLPASYFDFTDEQELRLCWNFINIRVARLEEGKPVRLIDLLSVRSHFRELYDKTGYDFCAKMLEKIGRIEASGHHSHLAIEQFILQNKEALANIATLDKEEFNRLNQGATVDSLLLEREILRKFGSGQ